MFDFFIAIGMFAGFILLFSAIGIDACETNTGTIISIIITVMMIVAIFGCAQVGITSDIRSFTKVVETTELKQIGFDYGKDLLIYADQSTTGTIEFKNLTAVMTEDNEPRLERTQDVSVGHANLFFWQIQGDSVTERYIVYVPREYIVENADDYDWSKLL